MVDIHLDARFTDCFLLEFTWVRAPAAMTEIARPDRIKRQIHQKNPQPAIEGLDRMKERK